jgi:hypothetical protein
VNTELLDRTGRSIRDSGKESIHVKISGVGRRRKGDKRLIGEKNGGGIAQAMLEGAVEGDVLRLAELMVNKE